MPMPLSPSTHVSNKDLWPLLSNVVDCNCAICPPMTTLQLHPQLSVVKTAAIPKLTFVCCSSQRLLRVEELKISFDDMEPSGGTGGCNQSVNGVDSSSQTSYLNDVVIGLDDSHRTLNESVLKERIRRMKIGLANKGRVPWNKGRKHNAETRERIKRRTLEALRDPKVRKKMAEHPRYHSDQIKEKISHSQRRVWQERLKSKRLGEKFLFSWEQSIANAARKGVSGQEELDWDSYSKIEQQLEIHQLLQAEEKEKQKLMAIAGAKHFIQSWRVNIAEAAKKGGSSEQELEWGSYKKIQREIVLLNQLQRTAEKVKAKEMAKVKAEKAARMKAIRKVMLMQKRKDSQEKTKGRGDINIQQHGKENEGKGDLEVAEEFKLVTKLTKVQVYKNRSSQVAREGNVFNSIFPIYNKLDIELIKREKMQQEVSLADQIKAARDKKSELH